MLGEEHRRLPGRVAAADQRHFGLRAQPRLDRRCPVPDAATLELRQPRHRRPAVARTAGDHHRARAQAPAIGQRQAVLAVARNAGAVEAGDLRRDHDLRAELLRLHEGAAGQRRARNAGRKSQVVLDARARAGLAAIGAAVEHDDIESLRGGVHRGGEPGGTGADDGDVEQFLALADVEHAEATAERRLARVLQHRAVGTDGKHVADRGAVLLDQRLGVRIVAGVEHVVRHAVAPQEVLQREQRRRLRPADQHCAARAGLDQRHAPQDQCADDAFAEIGLGDDQRAQLLRRHQQHLDLVERLAVDQRRPARQLPDFREKLARPLLDDRHDAAEAVALRDADMALEHDEHAGSALAGGEQAAAAFVALARAEAADALDFLARQHREHLVVARVGAGGTAGGVAVGHAKSLLFRLHIRRRTGLLRVMRPWEGCAMCNRGLVVAGIVTA